MKIKTILPMLIMAVFIQCKSKKFDANPPFKVVAANYSNWVGGQPGIRGINVQIVLSAEKNIAFDKLYFHNKITDVETKMQENKTVLYGYFNTSDPDRKQDKILHEDTKKEYGNKPPNEVKNFPFKLEKDQAVISYLENGETKYFRVKKITKTQ